jgi:TonB family protein
MAMDRHAVAKSRKRETVEQFQMAGAVAAEQRTISGVVISGEDEQPLPGVVVALKGSNTGTVTDLEGKFQISIEDDSQNTLIAQFIGMEPKEIPVEDEDELMITLEPDAISLEEVVVIGTGPSKIAQPVGYSVKVAVDTEEQRDQDYSSATPVGGKKEFDEYVKSNMLFPEYDDDMTRAVVVLNFVVGSDGRPTQVFVLKSPGKAFSDEAIRLLMDGPDWEPAEKNGKYYQEPNRIRIVFKKERP